MANICCFNMRLHFPTQEDCDACKAWLDGLDTHLDSYVHFPETDFKIFDLCIYYPEDAIRAIRIEGDVKWYIDFDEFSTFVEKLAKDFHLQMLRCDYSEPGSDMFGYYEYSSDTGLLVDRFVKQSYVNEALKKYDIENNDDDLDKFLAEMQGPLPDEAYEEISVML